MKPRVAIGGVFTECNHFGGAPTDLDAFARHQLLYGSDLLQVTDGTLGGMLRVLQSEKSEVVPLIMASTCPGGPLTSECYSTLKSSLLERLERELPVDGVLLALHGSAAAENAGDLEGDLLVGVRHVVGNQIPVLATLDLHAHVTEAMIQYANALVAWETYPHRDAQSTGERGARLLLKTVRGLVHPTMALAKVPVLIGATLGHTEGAGPFADVMRLAKSFEGQSGVLSTSAFLVHPYLDLPDMGSGGLVITDGDSEAARTLARKIALAYWDRRFDLQPRVYSPHEAITLGMEIERGPVLLLETADCCGGGAAGDSVATLAALLELAPHCRAIVPVVDPIVARVCHRAGPGATVTVSLGHSLDLRWGIPISVTGRVASLNSGSFRYKGGIFEGQEGNMGPSAVLRIGAIEVLVTSHATYDWADEQYQCVGLKAADAQFVVVKNPMNYRQTYAAIARAIFLLDTPGPTPAVMDRMPYRNVARPYYPADQEIPGLEPRMYVGCH